ncbi:MAG: DUF2431 domain-containing protein, partial [Alphaproteobacteria bacterium]|nr:DUF2431 domain-containing protein [Alphaproteobacteria bacterium]
MEPPSDGRDFTRPPETSIAAFIRGRKYIAPRTRAEILADAPVTWSKPSYRAHGVKARRPIFWSLLFRKRQLYLRHKKTAAFDFIAQIARGTTLLVGEGNLSFTVALTIDSRINPAHLTASTFESAPDLSDEAEENAKILRLTGVSVLYGVDATKLSANVGLVRFDSIVFQFPHVGSRDPVEGRNPNFILIRDFLKSARRQLASGGKVLISIVNTPHYRGAFQLEEAANAAGFLPPRAYRFDPDKFRGYHHTMTHQEGDALYNHDDFL